MQDLTIDSMELTDPAMLRYPDAALLVLETGNDTVAEYAPSLRTFLESGGNHRLLHKPIMIDCPVRLVHGDKDEDVPIGVAFKLLEDLHSGDVQLTIIKWGEHRMSEPHQITTILRTIIDMLEVTNFQVAAFLNDRIVGAVICNLTSEGINFSFLESEITALELDEDLSPQAQLSVFRSLVSSAVRYYREHKRI